MCEQFKKTKRRKVVGYKLVAKKGKRYYSLLTGNAYPKNGKVPIWASQTKAIMQNSFWHPVLPGNKRLLNRWIDGLVSRSSAFSNEMVGRSAVFFDERSAFSFLRDVNKILEDPDYSRSIKKGYKVIIVKAEVEEKLLEARYRNATVFAGKKLTILNEVST